MSQSKDKTGFNSYKEWSEHTQVSVLVLLMTLNINLIVSSGKR